MRILFPEFLTLLLGECKVFYGLVTEIENARAEDIKISGGIKQLRCIEVEI
jgi:hypothetical protein